MTGKLTFDVYGLLHVVAEPADGDYLALWMTRNDGKRKRLHGVLVERDANPDEIIHQLEACFHEAATPGDAIT